MNTANSNINDVLFGIMSIVQHLNNEAGALNAYSDYYNTIDNGFLRLSETCINRQLLMDLAKVFDDEAFKNKPNCSIKQLRTQCLAQKEYFPDGEKDSIIISIDALVDQYNSIMSRDIRNKRLAHFDLIVFLSMKLIEIPFRDIISILIGLNNLVTNIASRIYSFPPPIITLDEYTNYYETELKKCASTSNKNNNAEMEEM